MKIKVIKVEVLLASARSARWMRTALLVQCIRYLFKCFESTVGIRNNKRQIKLYISFNVRKKIFSMTNLSIQHQTAISYNPFDFTVDIWLSSHIKPFTHPSAAFRPREEKSGAQHYYNKASLYHTFSVHLFQNEKSDRITLLVNTVSPPIHHNLN